MSETLMCQSDIFNDEGLGDESDIPRNVNEFIGLLQTVEEDHVHRG